MLIAPHGPAWNNHTRISRDNSGRAECSPANRCVIISSCQLTFAFIRCCAVQFTKQTQSIECKVNNNGVILTKSSISMKFSPRQRPNEATRPATPKRPSNDGKDRINQCDNRMQTAQQVGLQVRAIKKPLVNEWICMSINTQFANRIDTFCAPSGDN